MLAIIGPRARAQLDDNIRATGLSLSSDHLNRLYDVSEISLGFLHEFLADPETRSRITGGKADEFDPRGWSVR